jgi:DNA-binding response OmpR family regulator
MKFEEVKLFFEQQSAAANFFEITFSLAAIGILIWRGAKWIRRRTSNSVPTSLEGYLSLVGKQGRRVIDIRILILDDELSDYPIDQLRKLGYRVEEKTLVSLGDIESFKNYDVILLDIRGVLKEDLRQGGLEILKRLKSRPNSPYVIAVSSKGFDPTLAEFFMLADERLKKPIAAMTIERAIRLAYEGAYSALHAAQRVDQQLGTSNRKNASARKNLQQVIQFLNGKLHEDKLRHGLEKSFGSETIRSILLDLAIMKVELR